MIASGMIMFAVVAAAPMVCLQPRTLELQPLPFDTEDHRSLRVHELVVTIPVSCRSGKVLQPVDLREGLRYLDWALPLDLKSAFGQKSDSGEGAIIYGASLYSGYSEGDSEAFRYLGGLWSESEYCKDYMRDHPDEGEIGCVVYLAEEYARWQVPRKPWDFESMTPSQPPPRKELDLPE